MKKTLFTLFASWAAVTVLAPGPVPGQETVPPPSDSSVIVDNATILVGAPEQAPRGGAELDRILEDVADRMRCPVCQGLSVADSHTDTALAMKAEARGLLAAGFSPEQTLSYFEASYGEFIRLQPKAQGFNLFVWIAPLGLILLGAGIVLTRVRGKRPAPEAAQGSPAAQDEDPELAAYLERVRDDVGHRDVGESP